MQKNIGIIGIGELCFRRISTMFCMLYADY
jgi:hypothetical protein